MGKRPIPDDDINKWEYKEHTKVKHEILDKYLDAWINILSATHNLNIFDCFAGRGEYQDGSPGSPVIILRRLTEIRKKRQKPEKASCIFIEKNESNYKNMLSVLENEINNNPLLRGNWLNITPFNDEFANITKKVLDESGKRLAPSFFFIDPFGISGVPFQVIKDILSIKRTELFITFMIRDANRFLESNSHRSCIGDLFNSNDVLKEISELYPNLTREQGLLKFYRDKLHNEAKVKYTRPYEMKADERLQTTYYLIHCTNNPKGCEIMKEIMFKEGTEGRFGYFGPAQGQMTLEQFNNIKLLKKFLLNKFKGQTLTYEDTRYKTLMDTNFSKSHYHETILELEEERKIEIQGKGPKGGLKDNALIFFK